jgi:hypothetical protein
MTPQDLQALITRIEGAQQQGSEAVRRRAHAAADRGRTSRGYGDLIAREEKLRVMRDAVYAEQAAIEERRRLAEVAQRSATVPTGEPYGQTMRDPLDISTPHSLDPTPPQESWQKWNTARRAADVGTGQGSMLSALRQFYLGQTEPDKYGGQMFSEGDVTGLGLSMAPLLAAPGLLLANSARGAALSGLASEVIPVVLGDHDIGDVATNTVLSGGIQKGANKLLGFTPNAVDRFLANPSRAGLAFRQAMTRPRSDLCTYAPGRALAALKAPTLPKPTPRPSEVDTKRWEDMMKEINRDIDRVNRPAPRAPGINPERVSDLGALNRVMRSMDEGPRREAAQYKNLSPFGEWVDDIPVEYAGGGSVLGKAARAALPSLFGQWTPNVVNKGSLQHGK